MREIILGPPVVAKLRPSLGIVREELTRGTTPLAGGQQEKFDQACEGLCGV